MARLLSVDGKGRGFRGDFKMTFHLAPPIFSKTGPMGARKSASSALGWSARCGCWQNSRGCAARRFDPFGYSAERKMERALIKQYEADMDEVLSEGRTRDDASGRRARRAAAANPRLRAGEGRANEAKAAKRTRGTCWRTIRAGGTPHTGRGVGGHETVTRTGHNRCKRRMNSESNGKVTMRQDKAYRARHKLFILGPDQGRAGDDPHDGER